MSEGVVVDIAKEIDGFMAGLAWKLGADTATMPEILTMLHELSAQPEAERARIAAAAGVDPLDLERGCAIARWTRHQQETGDPTAHARLLQEIQTIGLRATPVVGQPRATATAIGIVSAGAAREH